MAIIEGQIETLKKLRVILDQNGIARFKSINEIRDFIENYDAERVEISKAVANEFNIEINQLQIDFAESQLKYDALKDEFSKEINQEIVEIEKQYELIRIKSTKSFVHKVVHYPEARILEIRRSSLQKNFEALLAKKTYIASQEVLGIKDKLDNYTMNKDALMLERCLQSSQQLDKTKKIIDDLSNLIAGAIGEHSVIKEVSKLSDDFHLFNDFSLEFSPPIYHRKENDRIHSIQIDHLLVSGAGIFILETKNWSKKSIQSTDLRSPVNQILRSSYALFIFLNSISPHSSIDLECHHWGAKQIPIRNLIVMTGERPKEEFKHVKVLSLNELNGYVSYFDPIFTSVETEAICDYLRARMS